MALFTFVAGVSVSFSGFGPTVKPGGRGGF